MPWRHQDAAHAYITVDPMCVPRREMLLCVAGATGPAIAHPTGPVCQEASLRRFALVKHEVLGQGFSFEAGSLKTATQCTVDRHRSHIAATKLVSQSWLRECGMELQGRSQRLAEFNQLKLGGRWEEGPARSACVGLT